MDAENELFKKDRQETLERKRLRITRPESKAVQNRRELQRLQIETAEMQTELRLKQEIEVEFKRNIEAGLQLNEANLSLAERKERDAERRRRRAAFAAASGCLEVSDDWRAQATLAFNAKGKAGR